MKKYLKEIRRNILSDRKYTIKIGDEALVLIDNLLKKPSIKGARMLYNRLSKLDINEDLAEYIYLICCEKKDVE